MTLLEIADRYLRPDKSPLGWIVKGGLVCTVIAVAMFMVMGRDILLLMVGMVSAMLAFSALVAALVILMMRGSTVRDLRRDRETLLAGRYGFVQVENRSATINGVTVGQGAYIVLHAKTGKNVELWITDGGDVPRIVALLEANMRQAAAS